MATQISWLCGIVAAQLFFTGSINSPVLSAESLAKLLAKLLDEPGVDTVWFAQSRDARQAVAVDAQHAYAISDKSISKIHRATNQIIMRWQYEDAHAGIDQVRDADELVRIKHLNSGVIIENRLYSAHSNWPELPAYNTIEVWDVDSMTQVESIKLAGGNIWITWVDHYRDHWWVVLARYDAVTGALGNRMSTASAGGKDLANDSRTRLLQLDMDFKILDTWYFPPELISEFAPMSNSGGSWGPDGKLWLTGHDQPRAYTTTLPQTGSQLVWESSVPLTDIEGQGIAWDRSANEPILFGVRRTAKRLVAMRVTLGGVK